MSLLKVTIIFISIILTSRFFKARLWLCLLAGASLMGVVFGMPAAGIVGTFIRTTSAPKTLEILVILYGIAVFEYTLRTTGMLTRLVSSLKKIFGDDRLVLATLPAFLGFLPSPGGALFSAPLVEEASGTIRITPEQKSFINYWFRHIWETVFPLFPGLIMASSMSGIPIYKLASVMAPAALVNVTTGSFIVFHRRFEHLNDSTQGRRSHLNFASLSELFINLLPILVIITGALFFKINMVALIAIATAWAFIQTGVGARDLKKIFVDTLYSQNLMLIVAIMMFAGILEDSGAAKAIPDTFRAFDVPRNIIFMGMPFVLGIFTGINTAFVGLSFPILREIAGAPFTDSQVALAYVAGTAGIMLSPVHLCFILTLNYFKAGIFKFYGMLFIPTVAMLITAAILGGL